MKNIETPMAEENKTLEFGDYCTIEQHRYSSDNEHYTHKVIRTSKSNVWVDVPVMHTATETQHDHMEDVVWCICCGVVETQVLRYRIADVQKKPNKFQRYLSQLTDEALEAMAGEYATEKGLQCSCGNVGYTAEHDPCDPHIGGICSNCPIQVQCEFCYTNANSVFNIKEQTLQFAKHLRTKLMEGVR